MSNVKAYGTFLKIGNNTFRTDAYLQWGDSNNIIGSCVMCNPGSSMLEDMKDDILNKLSKGDEVTGTLKIDPTMQQIIKIVENINRGMELKGTFYIYNLFTLQNASIELATKAFENMEIDENILLKNYLDFQLRFKEIPLVLIAWGCENKSRIVNEKEKWLAYIKNSNIKFIGIEGKDYPNYLHPLQHGEDKRKKYIDDIIKQVKINNSTIINSNNDLTSRKHSQSPKHNVGRTRLMQELNDLILEQGFNHNTSGKVLSLCRDGIKSNPKRMELYLLENLCLINFFKDYNRALSNCNKAIQLDKTFMPIYVQKFQVLELLDRKDEALESLEEAVNIKFSKMLRFFIDGKIAEYRNAKIEAIIKYKKSLEGLELTPDIIQNNKDLLFVIYNSLGLLSFNMKKYTQACRYLSSALEFRESAESYMAYATSLFYSMNYYECMKICNRAYRFGVNFEQNDMLNEIFNDSKEKLEIDNDESMDEWIPVEETLNSLIGLENIKREIKIILNYLSYEGNRSKILNIKKQKLSYHFSFTGNPGTGKTTVARILGKILVEAGVLKKGHVVEVDRSQLVGQYIGETAIKTKQKIDESMEGILFIDEAYSLNRTDSGSDYGVEAIDTLVKAMEDYRGEFVVVLAGYKSEMNDLMKVNPGLKSRINMELEFQDYNDTELLQIAKRIAKERFYNISPDAEKVFLKSINNEKIDSSFANARTVRNIIEKAIREKAFKATPQNVSKQDLSVLTALDFGGSCNNRKDETVEEVLRELNDMTGLTEIKAHIKRISDYLLLQNKRRDMGLKAQDISLNMIFTGNPGTGKTTVARIISRLFKSMGILKKGQLVEVSREDLVGEHIGETAPKTLEKIKEAYGGVLFIDEAYSLSQGGETDYGKEALSTLIKEMEDNRDKLLVIMAGYTADMKQLLNINSGLTSRVGFTIDFPDYKPDEMLDIFKDLCEAEDYILTNAAEHKVLRIFNNVYSKRDKNFGNGRFVRQYFEQIKMEQANRVISNNLSDKELITILPQDILV